MVTAIYSAITEQPVDNELAMTGEVSIRGLVKPVGGVVAKLEAARLAGARARHHPKGQLAGVVSGVGRRTAFKSSPSSAFEDVSGRGHADGGRSLVEASRGTSRRAGRGRSLRVGFSREPRASHTALRRAYIFHKGITAQSPNTHIITQFSTASFMLKGACA